MKTHAENVFRSAGGQLRMSEAIDRGISRYMLYSMMRKGLLDQVSRGVYRLAELPPMSNPDLVAVSLRCPTAVICLISALSFHEITTQIPRGVSIAIPRSSRLPKIDYPPIDAHRFTAQSYSSGIEKHQIDGVTVKIYSPEKCLADCFKFRNRIGMDVVIEALKLYRERKNFNPDELLKFGKICRIEKIMHPYLEAML